MYRIGIDSGGTFTDAVLMKGEEVLGTCKVPSDNANPANAVFAAAKRICKLCDVDLNEVDDIVHGTTVATNVSLELNGPRVALITTKGFRDVLEIARLTRPASALYDLMDAGDKPLIARRDRFEVAERLDAQGQEIDPVCRDDVERAVLAAQSRGIDSIAVCLLFSFLNPSHELQVREIIREVAPDMRVSLSCEILPQIREYERTAATAINAYLQPVCAPYLASLRKKFADAGVSASIWVMQSNGGVTTPELAAEYPINLLMSGPSGGIVAVQRLSSSLNIPDAISVDMGGTSFDVSCVIDGSVPLVASGEAMGMPLRIPTVDISTIGTGGGSIAYCDKARRLYVGPRSAGARPGPACYGRGGTKPTVTDANAVLGYLPDGGEIGGEIILSRQRAVDACAPLAEELGLSVVQLAQGIREVSAAAMAGAVRGISVGKGRDPRSFALVAFGGAGPLHAVDIAKEMGISQVVIPGAAGVLSALGLVSSDFVRTFSQSTYDASPCDAVIYEAAANLKDKAKEVEESLEGGLASYSYLADMRYAGQNSTISVPLENPFEEGCFDRAKELFGALHRQLNGYADSKSPVVVDGVSLTFSKSITSSSSKSDQQADSQKPVQIDLVECEKRRIWMSDDESVEWSVFDMDATSYAGEIPTPCILTSATTNVVVPEDVTATRNSDGTVVIAC